MAEEIAAAQGHLHDWNADRKRQHAQSCRQRWRPIRKRVIADRIAVDPLAAPTLDESAENLREYWSTVSEEKDTCEEAMNEFNPFIQVLNDHTAHAPTLDEIEALISSTGNSSPGPDGIPYSACALDGARIPDGMLR